MTGSDYQLFASRTINENLDRHDLEYHALHGMVGEIGELHSIYQKKFQGHSLDTTHIKKELGDLLWFIAEYCTALGWSLDTIMQLNIDKLRSRYPDGFNADRSIYRDKNDI